MSNDAGVVLWISAVSQARGDGQAVAEGAGRAGHPAIRRPLVGGPYEALPRSSNPRVRRSCRRSTFSLNFARPAKGLSRLRPSRQSHRQNCRIAVR